jgi:hypothetical protein
MMTRRIALLAIILAILAVSGCCICCVPCGRTRNACASEASLTPVETARNVTACPAPGAMPYNVPPVR